MVGAGAPTPRPRRESEMARSGPPSGLASASPVMSPLLQRPPSGAVGQGLVSAIRRAGAPRGAYSHSASVGGFSPIAHSTNATVRSRLRRMSLSGNGVESASISRSVAGSSAGLNTPPAEVRRPGAAPSFRGNSCAGLLVALQPAGLITDVRPALRRIRRPMTERTPRLEIREGRSDGTGDFHQVRRGAA